MKKAKTDYSGDPSDGRTSKIWLVILGLMVVMLMAGGGLIYLFRSYQEATLASQKDQLINISESVANNIRVYLSNFQHTAESMVSIDQFSRAEEDFSAGNSASMERFLTQARLSRAEDISGLAYVAPDGKACSSGDAAGYHPHRLMGTDDTFQDLEIDRDANGIFAFRLSAAASGGGKLLLYIPLETVYDRTASYIHMGEDGYVMIKDSDGTILMHPVAAQIGIDVLADRKKLYPDFDYSELEELIAHQLAGESGVEIYHSYWWADNPPTRVRKVSAYLPVFLGDTFLSISAVMDYREISEPVQSVGIRILLLTILLVITLLVFILTLFGVLSRQRTIERENDRLRQINENLEQLRRQEEILAQQQRLQLIGTMTSGIAHEFNNLLTPIMGYSAMILSGMPEDDDNYEDMKEILGSAEKAKEIIDQITQFSRKNAEKMFEPIHIGEAVSKALVITEAAKPRQVKMESRLETNRDVCIGNPVQIYQMVVNLCNNAIQSMGQEGGTLTIVGEAMQPVRNRDPFFIGKEQKWFYRLSVKDTGKGMDRATQEQIFVPFFTTKKPGEGTGLGLSIVQRLVLAHDGYICVHSSPGEGSEFVIYLPLTEADDAAVEPYSSGTKPEN